MEEANVGKCQNVTPDLDKTLVKKHPAQKIYMKISTFLRVASENVGNFFLNVKNLRMYVDELEKKELLMTKYRIEYKRKKSFNDF